VTDADEVRVDRYDRTIDLVRGGRVYGSNLPEDMSGQVVGMLAALAISPEGPTLLRIAQVGFGTGASVAVALAAGSRAVDVFEQDGHVVAAAEALAPVTGLTFQPEERRPVHPALRIVPPDQAAEEEFLRYDVIFSPPATSVMAGPRVLLTVGRLENLASLLTSGGILVHHLPLADMQPETAHRLLRTFAHVFPYMVVVSAGRGSSDAFLIGSSSPLLFRAQSLRALGQAPALAELRRAGGGLAHPFDLAARVIFSSRAEVLAFVEGAQPATAADPLPTDAVAARPPVPRPDAPEADRQAWQEALATHRHLFQRMEMLREQMYGLDWTHGQVCPEGPEAQGCLLADPGPGEQGAETLVELALSLMAAGRFVEAQDTLESAAELAETPVLDRAQQVLTLLLDAPPDLGRRLPEALEPVRTALDGGRCDAALAAARPVAESGDRASLEDRLVAAYALVRCEGEDPAAMEQVASLTAPLARDSAFAGRYPEALYLAARSAVVRGAYEDATWTMVDYVARVEPPGDTPASEGDGAAEDTE
jgi:spermidine synthase